MKNGKYELVIVPEGYPGKRYRGRYAYEHHVVFWREHGRMPLPGCVVHHRDDQKRRNILENLEEKARGKHTADHNQKRGVERKYTCQWCGVEFIRRWVRPGKSDPCCNRSHASKLQFKKKLFPDGETGITADC